MAKILIVDDTMISREILRNILEAEGHIIVGEAVNGADGVQKYMDLQPDVVTMDITMPVMDGLSALKMIMEYDNNAKIIMVSSSAQNSKIVECMIMGAADFLRKPFETKSITASISQVLMLDNESL